MSQLCHALHDADFAGFDASARPRLRQLVTMTEYEADFPFPVAFPPQSLQQILGEIVSKRGLRQLRIAETEKYAHVTYFFNGDQEEPYAREERVLVHSPRDVATYDLAEAYTRWSRWVWALFSRIPNCWLQIMSGPQAMSPGSRWAPWGTSFSP